MKRTLRTALVMSVLVAGCAGTKEATRDGETHKGTGVVEDVQKNQFSVVGLNGSPNRVWFTVDPSTNVERKGQRIGLNAVDPGDAVKVSYEAEPGPERAYRVEVLTGGDAAKVKGDLEDKGIGGAGPAGTTNP
ncbi:MAG: hypothetical protein ACJ790_21885 [Myxococcaceae bacterium]